MNETIEELIYAETERRLKEMAAPQYVFPRRADKRDAAGIVAAVCVSLILIILCMTGAID